MKDLMEKLMVFENEFDEKEQYFVKRTNNHIALVQKAAAIIVAAFPEFKGSLPERVKDHDQSKLQEPERTPYIEITWRHKLENEKGEFDPINAKGYQSPGSLTKEDENKATLHHITTNEHHPEYWLEDKDDANINAKDRDKSDKVVDVSKMPDVAVAEMIADWQAMAEEVKRNTTREWYNKQKDVRWHFSEEQDKLIDKLIKVFEVGIKEASVFKSPSEEEIKKRHPKEVELLGMWVPFKIYSQLKKEYNGDMDLMATAASYGDSMDGLPWLHYRDLGWRGRYVDSKKLIQQVELIGGYNNFDVEVAKNLVSLLGDNVKYSLGREGSVVIYVKPVGEDTEEIIREHQEDDLMWDELNYNTGAEELRIWWD